MYGMLRYAKRTPYPYGSKFARVHQPIDGHL
jgi:hypothetical protein